MNPNDIPSFFGPDQAAAYDTRWAKSAPIRRALEFLARAVLQELPDNAAILCVGAGTGSELIDLAQAFPSWRFTAVDPAPAMLAICRQKAEAAGVASRCRFHEGFLDSLPQTEPFDGATSFLVSHFLTDRDRRRDFFAEIARRLRPGGYLVNADLARSVPVPSAAYDNLIDVWLRTHGNSSLEARQACYSKWEKDVAILPPADVAAIMVSAGFESPLLIYQFLFIHAWFAKMPVRDTRGAAEARDFC